MGWVLWCVVEKGIEGFEDWKIFWIIGGIVGMMGLEVGDRHFWVCGWKGWREGGRCALAGTNNRCKNSPFRLHGEFSEKNVAHE